MASRAWPLSSSPWNRVWTCGMRKCDKAHGVLVHLVKHKDAGYEGVDIRAYRADEGRLGVVVELEVQAVAKAESIKGSR
jgi:hypothetical protein